MNLTVKGWEKTKKADAKKIKLPSNGLTPALKSYEKARKALDKERTGKNLDAARKELKNVQKVLDEAIELFSGVKKADDLVGSLRQFKSGLTFSKEEAQFDELNRLCQRILDGDSHELLGR